jgi:ATP-dependent DNA helicase RecG
MLHGTARPSSDKAPAKAPKTPTQKALEKLGLKRDIDLALHLPLRYEDETRITKLDEAREGDTIQIEATVTACEVSYRPRKQLIVTVNDGTDTCTLRFFNFYPSQQKALAVGNRIRARGEAKGGFLGWTMLHPAFRSAAGDLPRALTPVYPTVAGLSQPVLRKAVLAGLAQADLSDTFAPGDLGVLDAGIGHHPLWTLREALSFLHHPAPDVSLDALQDHSHPAWQRLKAEELLAQQLSQLQSRRARAALRAPVLAVPPFGDAPGQAIGSAIGAAVAPSAVADPLHARLLATLPFALTAAQQRVGDEIAHDLARPVPMHRLLQGDVGSGKTVVAALAATLCMDAGWQCALMAPTEILAEQHFRKLLSWLEPLGITTAWLTGTQKAKERRAMLALIESGEAKLVVGTHAVIQEKVHFKNLALAVIDEQHRFGVAQRLALRNKMGAGIAAGPPLGDAAPSGGSDPRSGGAWGQIVPAAGPPLGDAAPLGGSDPRSGGAWGPVPMEPHMLMMTATPIPRTLAMSYYADLDVSTIDELPPGRTPIITKVLNENRRDEVIERIQDQVAQGRQVYWVCPLIEESEALDLTNVTETHVELSAALAGTRMVSGEPALVGLLHSRMPTEDKKVVMAAFKDGHIAVLVSTTVIEVGVDVPNASLMVIEHAERFGLSQLHQLRGRVGRGAAASACALLYSTGDAPRLSEAARARLKAMAETNDGFEIARRDLDIRGPGEFLGARQSGEAMLRFADLNRDTALLDWARLEAPMMLDHHPALAARHIARWLGEKTDFLKA